MKFAIVKVKRWARIAAIVLVSGIASGCTAIGEVRVADWPVLEVVEHYVPHSEMRERCARYVGPAMSPEACAEFNFAAARCDIWFSADFPPLAFVVEHEREHCLGYEHEGESGLGEILAAYRAQTKLSAGTISQGVTALARATTAER